MIGAEVDVRTNKDAARAVDEGVTDAIFEAADKGFDVAMEHVPDGATSTLRNSAFEPEETNDGSIIWGFRADYARFVEGGTSPHWAPIEPLKLWARRVTGKGASFAYYVQWKIAQEGTDPQPYVQPGVDAMKARLRKNGLSEFIEDKL